MTSVGRAVRGALGLVLGVGAVFWLAEPALSTLRGPRSQLVAELNRGRALRGLPELRAEPQLAVLARDEARRRARGLDGRPRAELERAARRAGWRGTLTVLPLEARTQPGPGAPAQAARGWWDDAASGELLSDAGRIALGVARVRLADADLYLVLLGGDS